MPAWYEQAQQGAVIVTVNQRLARDYLDRYQRIRQRSGDEVWETPAILPLDAWLRELHDVALVQGDLAHARLPALQTQQRWRHAVETDRDLAWLLDTDAVADNATRAWQLAHAWGIDIDDERPRSPDAQAFRRWASHYRRRCERDGVVDAAGSLDALTAVVREGRLCSSLPARLLYAGYLQLDCQQQRWFDALTHAGVLVSAIEAASEASLYRQCWQDDDDELTRVAEAVRQLQESEPESRIGVVVSDLGARRARVLRAFDRVFFPGLSPADIDRGGRPYELSLGRPLSEYPVVQAGLRIIALHVTGLQDDQLSSLLLSPYFKDAEHESALRKRFDRQCRDRRVQWLDAAGLRAALPSGCRLQRSLSDSLSGGFGHGPSHDPNGGPNGGSSGGPGDGHAAGMTRGVGRSRRSARGADEPGWASRFGTCLQLLGWPGQIDDSEEYQAFEAWHACLDDLQRLEQGETLDAGAALRQLRRLSRERIFQPQSPVRAIRVMGRLESHGLALDHLWVTGLDQDSWPPATSPTPYLPTDAQREAGVPEASPALALARAEAEFALWQRSASTLHVSHVRSREGRPLAAALCIAGLPVVPADKVLTTPWLSRIQAGTSLQSLPDFSGPPVPDGDDVRGGARLFEDQAKCPFKAFATHRLGVRALEEAGPGLDARQHGTLLHTALEHFWLQVRTRDGLQELVDNHTLAAALDTAIDTAMQDWDMEAGLDDLERRRLQRLLQEWLLNCELPREPFEVVAMEEERTVTREGIVVTLKVDRLDCLASGQQVMVDYKTGATNRTNTWSAERIENPQLPLYALSDPSVDGVCFAQIVRHDCRFVGMASEDRLLPGIRHAQDDIDTWTGWRQHWARVLDACATEISEGLATVTPQGKVCDFCDLKPLCRIDVPPGDDEFGQDPELEEGGSDSRSAFAGTRR